MPLPCRHRRPGRLVNVLCTFNLRSMSTGYWRRYSIFIVNLEHISHICLVFILSVSKMYFFEHGRSKQKKWQLRKSNRDAVIAFFNERAIKKRVWWIHFSIIIFSISFKKYILSCQSVVNFDEYYDFLTWERRV